MRGWARWGALALAAAAVNAGAARAEIPVKSATGFVTQSEVDIPGKTPFEVWQMLLQPAKWWNGLHTWSGNAENLYLDAQAGGCFCELLPAPKDAPEGTRRGSIEHARVMASMPPNVLRLLGALGPLQGEALTGTLTFKLKALPGEGGTHVTMSYVVGGFMRMQVEDIAPVVDKVLGEQLVRLGRVTRGLSAQPGPGEEAEPRSDAAEAPAAPPSAESAAPEAAPAPAPAPHVPAPKGKPKPAARAASEAARSGKPAGAKAEKPKPADADTP